MVRSHVLAGRWLVLALAVLAAGGAGGCGSSNRPYPVKGTIVFEDGSAARQLAGGSVVFTSDELNISASGDIGEGGTFQLTTHGRDDGALPGKYRVSVVQPDPGDGGDSRRARPRKVISDRYQDPETSGLEATVEAKANDITLTVQRGYRPGK